MTQRTQVLWAEWTDTPTGWSTRKHAHPFYHLFYVKSGHASFIVDSERVSVSSGSLLIVPPNISHEMPAHNSMVVFYEIKFRVLDLALAAHLEKQNVIQVEDFSRYEQLLRFIAFNWSSNSPEINDNIDSFLSTLLMATSFGEQLTDSSAFFFTGAYSPLTQQIISYIEQNYMEHFRLSILSEAIGRNEKYLCSLFKKDTGCTINTCLNFVRIRRAVAFLFYSAIPYTEINQIAQNVGFVDISTFNRVFKKFTGLTPGHFRGLYGGSAREETGSPNTSARLTEYYDKVFFYRADSLPDAIKKLRYLGEYVLSVQTEDLFLAE